MKSIVERLCEAKPILLDGATGTELNRRGVDTSLPLWSTRALLDAPDILREIHADYIDAGAEIITANTFRTHARNLKQARMESRTTELTQNAVNIARSVAGQRAWIAGSLAPLEDCYSPHLVLDDRTLQTEHRQMSHQLASAGVDLILVETQNTIREAVAAVQEATETGLPVFVSFVCGIDGRLLSGESISDAVDAVGSYHPNAILLNCLPADAAMSPLQELKSSAELPIGIYANVGRPDPDQGWINTDAIDPICYAQYAQHWLDLGVSLVGGCCGTTPAHISQIQKSL